MKRRRSRHSLIGNQRLVTYRSGKTSRIPLKMHMNWFAYVRKFRYFINMPLSLPLIIFVNQILELFYVLFVVICFLFFPSFNSNLYISHFHLAPRVTSLAALFLLPIFLSFARISTLSFVILLIHS